MPSYQANIASGTLNTVGFVSATASPALPLPDEQWMTVATEPSAARVATMPTWPTARADFFEGNTTIQPGVGLGMAAKNQVDLLASCTIASVLIHPPLKIT